MIPRTKQQKKVVELSTKLPKISDKQKLWFQEKMQKFAVRSRKSLYCLDCGHKWFDESSMISAIVGCTCPNCNADLKMYDAYEPHCKKHDYCAVLTTIDDVQVVRMFFTTKYFLKRKPAKYTCIEVMQHFIEPDGTTETVTRKVNSLSSYIDCWCWTSQLEVRSNTEGNRFRFGLAPMHIHPLRKILPIYKRNGFTGNFHGFAPHQLFAVITTDNKMETLLKAGQVNLMQYCYFKQNYTERLWSVIRICIRHNYIIKDASMWLDYIGFLEWFEKDVRNPKFVCPVDLKESHNILLAKKNKILAERKLKEDLQRAIDNEEDYVKKKAKFFKLSFAKGDIAIQPLKTVAEFVTEGANLNHCVYASSYYAKENSLILSAKVKNKPMETVEVSISKMTVIQSRGMDNQPSKYHKDIITLVNSNIRKIAKCV
jgi:hypothetical protein